MDQVGEITVHVYRGGEATADPDWVAKDLDSEAVSKVHEKALKGQAKSHAMASAQFNLALKNHANSILRFGPGSKVVKKSSFRSGLLDGPEYPLAIFRFKYRSRGSLHHPSTHV
jgi:hypothetical protein